MSFCGNIAAIIMRKALQRGVSPGRIVQSPFRLFSMRNPSIAQHIVAHSSFREIADHDIFERQVCGRFGEFGSERLQKLVLHSDEAVTIAESVANEETGRAFNDLFASKGVKGVSAKTTKHRVEHEFELDLCLKVNEEVKLRDLFDICCEEKDVVAFIPQAGSTFEITHGFENASTDNSTRIHFEITRSPSKATEKLLQLERVLALENECLPEEWRRASAIGLFINGDHNQFRAFVESVKDRWQDAINQKLRISQVPLYFAYTPFCNLYSSVRDVMDASGQEELRGSVTELRGSVKELGGGMQRIEDLLSRLVNK